MADHLTKLSPFGPSKKKKPKKTASVKNTVASAVQKSRKELPEYLQSLAEILRNVSVCVIEDEERIIKLIRSFFVDTLGMKRCEFINPDDEKPGSKTFVEHIKKRLEKIKLLVTDINYDSNVNSDETPGGILVADHCLKLGIPVIFMSGNSQNEGLVRERYGKQYEEGVDFVFIGKPLDMANIGKVASEMASTMAEAAASLIDADAYKASQEASRGLEAIIALFFDDLSEPSERLELSLVSLLVRHGIDRLPMDDQIYFYRRMTSRISHTRNHAEAKGLLHAFNTAFKIAGCKLDKADLVKSELTSRQLAYLMQLTATRTRFSRETIGDIERVLEGVEVTLVESFTGKGGQMSFFSKRIEELGGTVRLLNISSNKQISVLERALDAKKQKNKYVILEEFDGNEGVRTNVIEAAQSRKIPVTLYRGFSDGKSASLVGQYPGMNTLEVADLSSISKAYQEALARVKR